MVVPGRYAVRLTVGERSQTQSFDILPDPRIKTSASDLEAQFVFLKAILAKLATVNATINEIDAMLDAGREPRIAGQRSERARPPCARRRTRLRQRACSRSAAP